MSHIPALLLATAAALFTAPSADAQRRPSKPAPQDTLEKVVMVMRHGIRPPTKAQPIPVEYAPQPWPSWPVAPGLLTPRGAAGIALLGTSDRRWLTARGLIARGCPQPGAVTVKASGKPRAIDTARAWAAAFAPGCGISVDHPAADAPDPVFHGLDDASAGFDGARALREAQALLPAGGLPAEVSKVAGEIDLLARVLDCRKPACPLYTTANALVGQPHDRPELDGPVDVGSTASQTFLLEYLEGMPMRDVGWGRINRAGIERLLRFHPLKFRYSNRPDYVARVAAAPLAREIVEALEGAAKVTVLAGHDTNLADLAAFFDLHWKVPGYPADDVPPGGALGFELLRSPTGERHVCLFFRAQTMDQLRDQRPLTGPNTVRPIYLPFRQCDQRLGNVCRLNSFKSMVRRRSLDGQTVTAR